MFKYLFKKLKNPVKLEVYAKLLAVEIIIISAIIIIVYYILVWFDGTQCVTMPITINNYLL